MATWRHIEQAAPGFASRVHECFSLGTNKTIATIRQDGGPRISGIELSFDDGQVTFGMMGGSLKLRDVRRDPRVAIHSPTIDPPSGEPSRWLGDAKLAGTAVELTGHGSGDAAAGSFRLDITEVVATYVGKPADHLVIESWHPDRGWQQRTRR